MTKSHVGMGFHLCPVCGHKHDEVVLLDRGLRNSLEKENFLGWSLCPEHQKLFDDDFIALIETRNSSNNLKDADRTGNLAHVRADAFIQVFGQTPPPGKLVFVEEGVLAKLEGMIKEDPHDL